MGGTVSRMFRRQPTDQRDKQKTKKVRRFGSLRHQRTTDQQEEGQKSERASKYHTLPTRSQRLAREELTPEPSRIEPIIVANDESQPITELVDAQTSLQVCHEPNAAATAAPVVCAFPPDSTNLVEETIEAASEQSIQQSAPNAQQFEIITEPVFVPADETMKVHSDSPEPEALTSTESVPVADHEQVVESIERIEVVDEPQSQALQAEKPEEDLLNDFQKPVVDHTETLHDTQPLTTETPVTDIPVHVETSSETEHAENIDVPLTMEQDTELEENVTEETPDEREDIAARIEAPEEVVEVIHTMEEHAEPEMSAHIDEAPVETILLENEKQGTDEPQGLQEEHTIDTAEEDQPPQEVIEVLESMEQEMEAEEMETNATDDIHVEEQQICVELEANVETIPIGEEEKEAEESQDVDQKLDEPVVNEAVDDIHEEFGDKLENVQQAAEKEILGDNSVDDVHGEAGPIDAEEKVNVEIDPTIEGHQESENSQEVVQTDEFPEAHTVEATEDAIVGIQQSPEEVIEGPQNDTQVVEAEQMEEKATDDIPDEEQQLCTEKEADVEAIPTDVERKEVEEPQDLIQTSEVSEEHTVDTVEDNECASEQPVQGVVEEHEAEVELKGDTTEDEVPKEGEKQDFEDEPAIETVAVEDGETDVVVDELPTEPTVDEDATHETAEIPEDDTEKQSPEADDNITEDTHMDGQDVEANPSEVISQNETQEDTTVTVEAADTGTDDAQHSAFDDEESEVVEHATVDEATVGSVEKLTEDENTNVGSTEITDGAGDSPVGNVETCEPDLNGSTPDIIDEHVAEHAEDVDAEKEQTPIVNGEHNGPDFPEQVLKTADSPSGEHEVIPADE